MPSSPKAARCASPSPTAESRPVRASSSTAATRCSAEGSQGDRRGPRRPRRPCRRRRGRADRDLAGQRPGDAPAGHRCHRLRLLPRHPDWLPAVPDVLILVLRLLLAAVFGVAGWAKLSDREGTRRAVRDFGVPEALTPSVTFFLPLAELVVAVLLVFSATAVVGAIGAAVLLCLFIAAISLSLARGRQPDCHCFGQVHSEPVGPATLVRNGVLLAVAVVVIADGTGGPSLGGWWIAVVVGVVIGAALGRLLGKLARRGPVRRRIHRVKAALGANPKATVLRGGLPVGVEAPAFDLESTAGGRVSLSSLLTSGRP